jgi:hypothetical protein
MAFKIKKFNHSPQWYREHCRAENGGSAAFRAMLKNDMAYIDADNDPHACYQEKVGIYEERWNAILKGEVLHEPGGGVYRSDMLKNELLKVIEREFKAGFRPSDQFTVEPFKTIDDLMTESGLDENVMREFLRWRSRRGVVVKREAIQSQEPASRVKAREKLRQVLRGHRFFE